MHVGTWRPGARGVPGARPLQSPGAEDTDKAKGRVAPASRNPEPVMNGGFGGSR